MRRKGKGKGKMAVLAEAQEQEAQEGEEEAPEDKEEQEQELSPQEQAEKTKNEIVGSLVKDGGLEMDFQEDGESLGELLEVFEDAIEWFGATFHSGFEEQKCGIGLIAHYFMQLVFYSALLIGFGFFVWSSKNLIDNRVANPTVTAITTSLKSSLDVPPLLFCATYDEEELEGDDLSSSWPARNIAVNVAASYDLNGPPAEEGSHPSVNDEMRVIPQLRNCDGSDNDKSVMGYVQGTKNLLCNAQCKKVGAQAPTKAKEGVGGLCFDDCLEEEDCCTISVPKICEGCVGTEYKCRPGQLGYSGRTGCPASSGEFFKVLDTAEMCADLGILTSKAQCEMAQGITENPAGEVSSRRLGGGGSGEDDSKKAGNPKTFTVAGAACPFQTTYSNSDDLRKSRAQAGNMRCHALNKKFLGQHHVVKIDGVASCTNADTLLQFGNYMPTVKCFAIVPQKTPKMNEMSSSDSSEFVLHLKVTDSDNMDLRMQTLQLEDALKNPNELASLLGTKYMWNEMVGVSIAKRISPGAGDLTCLASTYDPIQVEVEKSIIDDKSKGGAGKSTHYRLSAGLPSVGPTRKVNRSTSLIEVDEWSRDSSMVNGTLEVQLAMKYRSYSVMTTTITDANDLELMAQFGALWALVAMVLAVMFKEIKPAVRKNGVEKKQYMMRLVPSALRKNATDMLRQRAKDKALESLAKVKKEVSDIRSATDIDKIKDGAKAKASAALPEDLSDLVESEHKIVV